MGRVVVGMNPHKRSVTIEVMAADEAVLGGGRHLDRDRPLVRIHPDHDPTHPAPPTLDPLWLSSREGTATSSRANPS